jgi:hypothetical protein
MRRDVDLALKMLEEKLIQYQDKFKSKTLRLCFSTQLELYSIFLKIFGNDVFVNVAARKVNQLS